MGVVPGSSVVGTSDLRVVFVDPDDENTPWWWPALVVSPKEFQQFRQTMEIEIEEPKEGEYLVCYFEDGSFSVVPEAAAMPFCPTKPPYTTYLNGRNGAAFRADNAVRLATDFWTNGVAPPSFAWLHSLAKPETSASGQSGKKRLSVSSQGAPASERESASLPVAGVKRGLKNPDAPAPKKSKRDHSHSHGSDTVRKEKEKEKSNKGSTSSSVAASKKSASHKRSDTEKHSKVHAFASKLRMLSHSPLSSDSSSSEEELPARLAESRKKRSSAIGKADTPATPRAPSPASLPAPSEANLCSGSNCTNVNCACRTRRQSDDASLGAPVFNPICVMKRSERPEITTMRDFLPLSRKKLWLERLEVYNKGSAAVSQPAVSLSVPTPQFYSQATRSPPVNSPKPSQPSPPSLRQQRHTLSPVLPNMYPTPPSEYLHQSPLEHTYPPYSGIRGNTNGFSTRLASAMPPPPVPSRATPAHVIQTISQAPNPSFPVYSYQPSVVSTNFSQQPNRTGLTNPYQQEAFPQQSPSRSSAVASPAMMTSHGPVVHVSTAVPARPPPLPHNFAPAIHSAHPYHPAGGGHPPGTVFISGNQASRDGNTGSPHPAPVSMVPFQVGSIGRRSSVSTIPGSAPSTPGMASAEVDGFGGGDNRSFAPPSGHFFYLTQ